MAMNQTRLVNEMKAMTLYDTEIAVTMAWANAFANYFQGDGVAQGAESNLVYVAPAAIPAAKAAMVAALSGMSAPGVAAAKIAASVMAFWGSLAAAPATAWPTATLITPPVLLANLATTLQTNFDANTSGAVAKDPAMGVIAATIHAANQGGSATWPGTIVFPIL